MQGGDRVLTDNSVKVLGVTLVDFGGGEVGHGGRE